MEISKLLKIYETTSLHKKIRLKIKIKENKN